MGIAANHITRKGQLVTPRRPACLQGMAHHRLADSLPLPVHSHGDILHNPRRRAAFTKLTHDLQRIGASNLASGDCNQQPETRSLADPGKVFGGFGEGKRIPAINSGFRDLI